MKIMIIKTNDKGKKFTLEQATKTQKGGRSKALPFFNLGTKWGLINATTQMLDPRERDQVPIVQAAGLTPGPVWMGAENLAHTVIRSPDCNARSESLYQLRYPGP
jgi:hypothetical protein